MSGYIQNDLDPWPVRKNCGAATWGCPNNCEGLANDPKPKRQNRLSKMWKYEYELNFLLIFFFFLKFKISCTWFVGMGVSDRVTVGIGRVRWDVGHKQMVSQPPEAPTIGQWYGRHGDVRHGEHAGYRCQWRLGAGCREHDILEIRKRFTSLLVRSIINR